jgi:hypothetical protein
MAEAPAVATSLGRGSLVGPGVAGLPVLAAGGFQMHLFGQGWQ